MATVSAEGYAVFRDIPERDLFYSSLVDKSVPLVLPDPAAKAEPAEQAASMAPAPMPAYAQVIKPKKRSSVPVPETALR